MKSIANKILYSLNGAFNFIGKELGHLYELASYVWAKITGTNMTINNTMKGPMRITLKASELSQDATPTPSSPQDIHTISGDNTLVVGNKNLLPYPYKNTTKTTNGITFTDNGDGTITANGTASADAIFMLRESTEELPQFVTNTSYILSGCKNDSSSVTYNNAPYYIENAWSGTRNFNTNGSTFTYSAISFIRDFRIVIKSGQTVNNLVFKPMIRLATITDTSYEPHQEQTAPINLGNIEYCKIGDYEDKFVRSDGENLIDYDNNTNYSNQYIDNSGNWVTGYSGYINQKIDIKSNVISIYIGSKVGDAYIRLGQYKSDGTFITRTLINATTNNISLDSECNYIWVSIDKGSSTYFKEVSLNLGSTATDYVPYGTNQWYLKKNIGKVVLDGSENWVRNSTYTNAYYVDNYFTDILQNADRTMLSDYFTYGGKMSSSAVVQVGQFYTWSTILNRIILGFDAPDLATFKTWLSTHNTDVYYVLGTPTYTQITGTLETQLNNIYKNMLSYKGTTNVSQINNDLPFELTIDIMKQI